MNNCELYHYGVKGMKWGQRKDRKAGRVLTRKTAAAKRNLRESYYAAKEDEANYKEASKAYRQARSGFAVSRRKKQARIDDAERELNKASARAEVSRAKVKRANDIYDKTAKQLEDHINEMNAKYGKDQVKQLSSKNYKLGKEYAKNMFKTGVTIADLPIIGTAYTGNYVGQIETSNREKLLNDRVKDRAQYHYR